MSNIAKYDSFESVLFSEGVRRMAFPAYRVFIFGYEITNDVVAVRVNQSGGSAERSAGSCSITLLNPNDKYIINHQDTLAIGISRDNLLQKLDKDIKDFPDTYHGLWQTVASGDLNEYFTLYRLAADEPIMQETFKEITKKLKGDLNVDFDYGSITDIAKYSILKRKMGYKVEIKPTTDTSLVRYDRKTIFEYFFQEGDCVFHPNDPVRIAFRDPFDPRQWYWVFSGFVDGFSESLNSNKESVITINCTDVSKMLRYAMLQLSTGFLDPNIEEVIEDVVGKVNTKFVPYRELFAGMTMFEILEIIFFGAESLKQSITNSVNNQVANMSQEELLTYAITNLNMNYDDIAQSVDPDAFFSGMETGLTEAEKSSLSALVKDSLLNQKLNVLTGKDVTGVINPRGVTLRRKNDKFGVHAYFWGIPDAVDESIGDFVDSLHTWNEILHHRVRITDLDDMSISDTYYYYNKDTDLSIDKVITIIGLNEKYGVNENLFPVGGGRIFYMTYAGLESALARDALDRSFGGVGSMHSEFRDRLSFIYDLAERVDFRFYATPRGDLVFEMPFYDFNPSYFWDKLGYIDDVDRKKQEMIDRYVDISGGKAYDGKYEGVAQELTELSFRTEFLNNDLEIVDYENMVREFDYRRHFTINTHEQYDFQNNCSDTGILTAYRCLPKIVRSRSSIDDANMRRYKWAASKELMPVLGFRPGTGDTWGFIDTYSAAEQFAALMLNKLNAEARNINVSTVPKFGLMVNRPIEWKHRNYYATIVSLSHSITWNSDCSTTISMNQVRGWNGQIDESGMQVHKHFGDQDRPFNLAEFIKQSGVNKDNKNEQGTTE